MSHNPYGLSRGFSSSHPGHDILTPVGTVLGAPYAGECEVRKITYSYGWHVRLWVGDRQFILAHLSDIYVNDGQTVPAGFEVGASGGDPANPRSGNSTGPHLHFEVRDGGTALIPTSLYGSLFHPGAQQEDDVKLIRIGGEATVYACLWGFKVAVPSKTVLEKMGGSFNDVYGVNSQHPLAKLPTLDATAVGKHLNAGAPIHG